MNTTRKLGFAATALAALLTTAALAQEAGDQPERARALPHPCPDRKAARNLGQSGTDVDGEGAGCFHDAASLSGCW